VENGPGFKIAQTGSGTGGLSGGPGYNFRDEIQLPELKHDPYILAMANSGLNTNGSQIYLTGSAAIPSLDGKHTVFGIVKEVSSRSLIDQIMAAGSNTTTITGITIHRNGAAAQSFDEFGQGLPLCQAIPGKLTVDSSGGFNSVTYVCNIPLSEGAVLRLSDSLDLRSWGYYGQLTVPSNFPPGISIGIENTLERRKFYNFSLTTFPDSMYQRDLRCYLHFAF
jgi:cyclophilin family peptidyl-prolyl cis-trans isomerase